MKTAPKALRLHIGLFGRTNVGKSSLMNLVTGQRAALTSPWPGTTTDVVEKAMELLPLGPVVFLDTAGLDDTSQLAALRMGRTKETYDRCDVALLVVEPGRWEECEDQVLAECAQRNIPVIVVVNKTDLAAPDPGFMRAVEARCPRVAAVSCLDEGARERHMARLKQLLIEASPEEFFVPPPLIGDLLPPGGLVMMMVPIDLQAPKGRLILPQVQAIRDALDNDASCWVVKDREFAAALTRLTAPPDLVVCDSQVVLKMTADTPPGVPCTTFSILFSRLKGDLPAMVEGACAIDRLRPGDRVLIAEACSHHAIEDDIGRVKIPRWLRQYVGGELAVETCAGADYPADLVRYKLIVHCGACMITRRQMMARLEHARQAGVPVTNYGVAISHVQGVLRRALSPFPAAFDRFDRMQTNPGKR